MAGEDREGGDAYALHGPSFGMDWGGNFFFQQPVAFWRKIWTKLKKKKKRCKEYIYIYIFFFRQKATGCWKKKEKKTEWLRKLLLSYPARNVVVFCSVFSMIQPWVLRMVKKNCTWPLKFVVEQQIDPTTTHRNRKRDGDVINIYIYIWIWVEMEILSKIAEWRWWLVMISDD